jgi:hypothetical protein
MYHLKHRHFGKKHYLNDQRPRCEIYHQLQKRVKKHECEETINPCEDYLISGLGIQEPESYQFVVNQRFKDEL